LRETLGHGEKKRLGRKRAFIAIIDWGTEFESEDILRWQRA
jgi:hypothetical protein